MILGLLMTLEYIMLVIVIGKYFPKIVFIPYCILIELPHLILYQTQVLLFSSDLPHLKTMLSSVLVLATQTTLIGLTLIKHILARRTGWGGTPLASLLIRDGTATYLIECGTALISFDIVILTGVSNTVVTFFSVALSCKLRDERSIIIFL
jgi:hypothetical protein